MFRIDGRVGLEPLVRLLGCNHTLQTVPDHPTIRPNRSDQLERGKGPLEAAGDRDMEVREASMAALITLAIVTVVAGGVVGLLLRLSFAIRGEDRIRGSLRFDPPNASSKAARDFVGVSSSRWK